MQRIGFYEDDNEQEEPEVIGTAYSNETPENEYTKKIKILTQENKRLKAAIKAMAKNL